MFRKILAALFVVSLGVALQAQSYHNRGNNGYRNDNPYNNPNYYPTQSRGNAYGHKRHHHGRHHRPVVVVPNNYCAPVYIAPPRPMCYTPYRRGHRR